jgi:nucleotide-binding universal stress UspA family protein
MSAYKKILVAVDGSPAAQRGLREAIRLARSQHARLFIVHVVNEFMAYNYLESMAIGTDVRAVLREAGRKILERAQAEARKQGVKAATVMREIVGGAAAGPIVREARKLGADLIVLGTHGRRGVRRLVLGSDAEQVVRTATVPVLLVRGKSPRR